LIRQEVGEASRSPETSQLGWHPTGTAILYCLLHIYYSKREKIYTRGGTRPKPSEKKQKLEKKKNRQPRESEN